jgi:hypothetical protein
MLLKQIVLNYNNPEISKNCRISRKTLFTNIVMNSNLACHIATRSKEFFGGPYSEKTLRRWIQRWRLRFARHQVRLWEMLLHAGIERELLRERHSDFRALSAVWKARHNGEKLLSALLSLDRSPLLAACPDNPTEAGHGSARHLP